jgi:hypothetical protein
MRRAFNLRTPVIRDLLRTHEALKDKKLIGRGMFSMVFDNGDTVLKLTCDDGAQGMYSYCGLEGKHYPRLIKHYGEVAELNNGIALHLCEVEKLERLPRGGALSRLANRLTHQLDVRFDRFGVDLSYAGVRAIETLVDESADTLGKSMVEALQDLSIFLSNFEARLDLHRANFMVRSDTLILNDPVVGSIAAREYIDSQRRRLWA